MALQALHFQALEDNGWVSCDTLLPAHLHSRLLLQSRELWLAGYYHEAGIGRHASRSRNRLIRGDSICWLDATRAPAANPAFFAWAAEIRRQLTQRYYLGLQSEEFHFARYPAGSGYKKHIDQHIGSPARKISMVVYLNETWTEADGGELCLYSPEEETREVERILPQGRRVVLFRSDSTPHEVLPAVQTRWSVAGWFRSDAVL